MKKSNFNYNNQYYNSPTRSRYSSRSSRRLHSECGSRESINSRNRFYHRIEKACTTFNNNDVKKEVFLYRKEIERLEKELLKKDKIIFELKESSMHNKQLQTELIEAYRVLYMYEGKISEYQKQLKKLELTISSRVDGDLTDKVEQLLESFRFQNSQVMGHLQQKNKVIMELEAKLKRLENKYFSTAWKLSSTKRQISNPLKKRFPNLRNTITIDQAPIGEKERVTTGNLRSKNANFTGQYQIAQFPPKEKESMRFKKVGGTIPYDNQLSPSRAAAISGNSLKVQQCFSFLNNSGSSIGNAYNQLGPRISQSNKLNSVNQATTFTPSAPISIKPVELRSLSNTNINSQMTVSNSGTAKRLQFREYRQDSPQMEFRGSSGRLELGKNIREIETMIRDGQRRGLSPSVRAPLGSQSIYLK